MNGTTFFEKNLLPAIASAVLIATALLSISFARNLRDSNDLELFVPPDPAVETSRRIYRSHFGTERVLVVSCRSDSPISPPQRETLQDFFSALEKRPEIDTAISLFSLPPFMRNPIVTGGILGDRDGRVFNGLLRLDRTHFDTNRFLKALEALAKPLEDSGISVTFGGETFVNAYLTRAAEQLRRTVIPLAFLGALLIVGFRARSPRRAVPLLLTVLVAIANAVLPILLFRFPMHLLLVLVPVLSAVIALTGSIHILAAHEIASDENLRRTKWRATALCFGTTAVGFGSLAISAIPAVRQLGLCAGLGLTLAGATVLTLLPLLLDLFHARRSSLETLTKRHAATESHIRAAIPGWTTLAVLIIAFAFLFFTKLPTEIRAEHYFPEHHPVRVAGRVLERDFLPMRSFEILLTDANLRSEWNDLTRALEGLPGVVRVLSRPLPGLPVFSADGKSGRLSVFVTDTALARPKVLLDGIRETISAHLGPQGRSTFVGSASRIVAAQFALRTTLVKSLLITGIAMALLFALLSRSFVVTSAAVIANAFPIVTVFYFQYAVGFPLDIGTILAYSVCLGLAVDDTIHLVMAMPPDARSLSEAVREAIHHCHGAVKDTSWILAVGFLLLSFSHFLPVRCFGILVFLGVLAALMGDLAIFPSVFAFAELAERRNIEENE